MNAVFVAAEKQIVRLQIAMNDPESVRAREPLRRLREDRRHLGRWQALLPGEACAERLPLEELHHDVRASAVEAVVEDVHDVGLWIRAAVRAS